MRQPTRCMLPEARHDRCRARHGPELPQNLEQGQVRLAGPVLLDALSAPYLDRLAPAQLAHEGVDHGRLPDAWLAGHEDGLTVATPGCLESLPEPRQLSLPTHAGVR